MIHSPSTRFEAIIVGGGPVGYATALAFALKGRKTALVTGGPAGPDLGRTAALLQGSLDFFTHIGLENELENISWPLAAIRMIDAKGGLFRAPTVTFRASELGLMDFGRNVQNTSLVECLHKKAETIEALAILGHRVISASFSEADAKLELENGTTLHADVILAADGRNSFLRQQADITTRAWDYPQTALTFHVAHQRDHEDISTEFHTREGPFTLVPLGQNLSSVVWVVTPGHAESLLKLEAGEFASMAEKQSQSLLGKLTLQSRIGAWPLSSLIATQFYGTRLALAGEAAHAFPPIGAQGLNLGIRDAIALEKLADETDMGASGVLKTYSDSRRVDVAGRTFAVDMFNRSLMTGFLPIDIARGLGLATLSAVTPLRKAAMKLGMGM